MSAREQLLREMTHNHLYMDDEQANELIDAYAHELAEQIRAEYGEPRWPGEEPEYAYGLNAGTHDAADLIDPQKSAGLVRPGEENTP